MPVCDASYTFKNHLFFHMPHAKRKSIRSHRIAYTSEAINGEKNGLIRFCVMRVFSQTSAKVPSLSRTLNLIMLNNRPRTPDSTKTKIAFMP